MEEERSEAERARNIGRGGAALSVLLETMTASLQTECSPQSGHDKEARSRGFDRAGNKRL